MANISKAYQDTTVAVSKSQDQIRTLLKKYSVVAVRFTSFPSYSVLEFVREVNKVRKPYRIVVKPKPKYNYDAGKALDQAERQVWRVAYWWLKSKLEAIDFGLVEFEQEMLPYMLIADAQGKEGTVAEFTLPVLSGGHGSLIGPFGGLRLALPEGRAGEGEKL